MKQLNNGRPVLEKLDHKHRNKSEITFYRLMARQKLKANPFDTIRTENWNPHNQTKPGVN